MKRLQLAVVMIVGTSAAYGRPLGDLRPLSGAEKDLVRATVEEKLKDPGSAQYQWFKYNGVETYCARVNAKNAYGGYIGFYEFQVDVRRDQNGRIVSASNPAFYGPDASAAEMMRKVCAVSAKADSEDRGPSIE